METSVPTQLTIFTDGWMGSAADFHVKTSHAPEKVRESLVNVADSGKSLPASSEKHNRHGRSSKIVHSCALGEWKSCWKTLPRSGTMRNGRLTERQMLVPLTDGTASGSWLTPTKHNSKESASHPAEYKLHTPTLTASAAGGITTRQMHLNHKWIAWLMGWPVNHFVGITDLPLPLLEMAGFRRKRQKRSANSGSEHAL